MKKIFIILFTVSTFITFLAGYFICSIKKNREIETLNNDLSYFKNMSTDYQKDLDDIKSDFEIYKLRVGIDENKHPIDEEEDICISQSNSSVEIQNCIKKSTKEWEKEIQKYLQLLKKEISEKDYELIKSDQNLWIKQSKKNKEVINHFVYNHGGNIYVDFALIDYRNIQKSRAEFLQHIFETYKSE